MLQFQRWECEAFSWSVHIYIVPSCPPALAQIPHTLLHHQSFALYELVINMPFPPADFLSNKLPKSVVCTHCLQFLSTPTPSLKFTSVSSHLSLTTTPLLVKSTYGLHVAKLVTTLSLHIAHILAALDRNVLPPQHSLSNRLPSGLASTCFISSAVSCLSSLSS